MIKFIKNNWTDPVWSKVFAAGIISLVSVVGLFIWSILKKIPLSNIWNQSFIYLQSNSFKVSYLAITIISFALLAFLIPMVLMKVISIQLKNLKVSSKLKTQQFNIETLLNGMWDCSYTRISNNWKGFETAEIREGNKYYLDNKLYFVLTNIEFDNKKQTISWTKTTYPSPAKHSREILEIDSSKNLKGKDDIGFIISYTRKG